MLRFVCARGASVRPLKWTPRVAKRVRQNPRQAPGNVFSEAESSSLGQVIPGYSTGAKLTAGCAGLGLAALTTVYNGFNVSQNVRAVDKAAFWPAYVKERIASSYAYVFNGLLVTGCATYGIMRSPRLMSLAARGGMLSFFATIAGMIGLQVATRAIPYESEGLNAAKHAAWGAHAAFMGFVIAPLIAMYGDVVAQAALYTGGIVGGISALGWTAPSKDFMMMQGPFAMFAGAIFVAAMASPFFNPVSPAGGALFSLVLWGGLVFSGIGVFMSTQRMLHTAEAYPAPGMFQAQPFDPVNASLSLYVDIIMMFQRLVFILGSNKRK